MNQFLKNKKILFLTWPFYDYPIIIKKEMEKFGANVTMYYSSEHKNFLNIRLAEMFPVLKRKYLKRIMSEIKKESFDFIFVLNPTSFPESFFRELTQDKKKAKMILYLWDSVEVFKHVVNYFSFFDSIYSFEKGDCLKYNLKFLPLFYQIDEINKNNLYKYDLCFIGFCHSERYQFVRKILKEAKRYTEENYIYLYLPSYVHYFFGKYIRGLYPKSKLSEFQFKSLSYNDIKNRVTESKIVIDLELKKQTGLTMRTIEAVGMRKKIITTNKDIINYDFYDENNILIVDRYNPKINKEFFLKPYKELPQNVYMKYDISCWIKFLFEN